MYYNIIIIIDVVIIDPPKFEQGNNVTNLTEFPIGPDAQVVATLSGANPPITSLVITNDSMNTADVVYEVYPY